VSGNYHTLEGSRSPGATTAVPTPPLVTAPFPSPLPPSPLDSLQPSLQPSFVSSFNRTVPFTSTAELHRAVDEYVAMGDRANGTRAAQKYGFPIGTLNVSLVTDFSQVFDAHGPLCGAGRIQQKEHVQCGLVGLGCVLRHFHGGLAYARQFNGSIFNWQTSKVTKVSFMFAEATVLNGDLSA
jgi:Mycoplasma protein of unknown function, DUF285